MVRNWNNIKFVLSKGPIFQEIMKNQYNSRKQRIHFSNHQNHNYFQLFKSEIKAEAW